MCGAEPAPIRPAGRYRRGDHCSAGGVCQEQEYKEISQGHRVRQRPVGHSGGYCSLCRSGPRLEHSSDPDGKADHVQPTEKPQVRRNKNILVIGGSGSGKTRSSSSPPSCRCTAAMWSPIPKDSFCPRWGPCCGGDPQAGRERKTPAGCPREGHLSVVAEGRRDGEYDYSYRTQNPIIVLDTYDYGKLPLYEISLSLHDAEQLNGVIYKNADFSCNLFLLDRTMNEFMRLQIHVVVMQSIQIWLNFLSKMLGTGLMDCGNCKNRSLLISVILTLLLLILEIQITTLVLRISYETHAKELTVKKVLGYSMIERYRGFFLLSGAICATFFIGALFDIPIF